MNLKTCMVVAVVGLAAALAVCAGAQPGDDAASGPQSRPSFRPPDVARPPLGEFAGQRRPFQPTTDQVREAEAFVSVHSPHHFKAYEEMAIHRYMHAHMELAIVQGFIELRALEAADPELYKLKLDEIAVQDKIFGLTYAQRDSAKAVDKKSLREQVRPLEQELIELRKSESRHRLERMAEALEKEKARLAGLEQLDSHGMDLLIDQDIERNRRGPFGGLGRGFSPAGQSGPPQQRPE